MTGMFISDLGFSHHVEGDGLVGEVELGDEARFPGGRPRPSLLATVADVLAGALANQLSAPRVALTTDLSVRDVQPTDAGRVEMRAGLLKAGRTLVTAEVWFLEPGSQRPIAVSHSTFMASPRPQDVIDLPELGRAVTSGPLRRPFPELVGARVVGPGVAELDRTPAVLQPAGTIQGGAVALLGEVAAESATGAPVTDIELRYLSTIRVGPARTSSTVFGGSSVRVEIRDVAQPGRLATLVLARTTTHGGVEGGARSVTGDGTGDGPGGGVG
jgi:acyl-coenzyme A thioesterase PaaI-like protein